MNLSTTLYLLWHHPKKLSRWCLQLSFQATRGLPVFRWLACPSQFLLGQVLSFPTAIRTNVRNGSDETMTTKLNLAQTRKLLADTEHALYLTEQAWLRCNADWTAQAISADHLRNLRVFSLAHPSVKMTNMNRALIGDDDAEASIM